MTKQLTPTQLVDELVNDQRRRWQDGDRVPAEVYLKEHPALQGDADCAVEVIYHEVLLREQRGETPRPEEYLRRFPQFAFLLQRLFEVHRELELDPLLSPDVDPAPRAAVPTCPVFNGYEVLSELGRGGMGVVYRARQISANRIVALKTLLPGTPATPQDLDRFRDEAQKLAGLSHPNLVPIYEVGEQDGLPFYSMEFVEGRNLAQKLHGTPLPARQAAALMETLARAVHFVHQNGIIHRDLKPANILLAEVRGQGSGVREEASRPLLTPDPCPLTPVPKITDFGLARRLDAGAGHTPSWALPGTPSYMAPEQVRDQGRPIGVTADVYGLGATLYEVLTGRPPFQGATMLETLEQVLYEEPVPPSRLQPKVPHDLETICLKCLRKDPAGRYAGAEELADDLRRFLVGEPIRARPVGWRERAVKWARRRPAAAVLLGISVLAALGLLAGGVGYGLQVRHYNEHLERQIKKTEAERRTAQRYWYALESNRTQADWLRGDLRSVRRFFERWEPLPDLHGFEWGYLRRLAGQQPRTLFAQPDGETVIADSDRRVAFSPDGGHVAAAVGSRVQVWDAVTGREVPRLKTGHDARLVALAFSADGRYVAAAGGSRVKVWDWKTGDEVRTLEHAGVSALAFSPQAQLLVSADNKGLVQVWDMAEGTVRHTCQEKGRVRSVALSPDGKRLALVAGERAVKVWDLETGAVVQTLRHAAPVNSVAFHPDGKYLVSAGGEPQQSGEVNLWEATTGEPVRSFLGHTRPVSGVAFSPDGRHLATAGKDIVVRVWETATGRPVLNLKGHDKVIVSVAFSPDGERLAAASLDQTVQVWDRLTNHEVLTLARGHTGPVFRVAFSPDGRLLASAGQDKRIQVWDIAAADGRAAPGRPWLSLTGHRGSVLALAFSPDGRRLASAGSDRTIKVWDVTVGKQGAGPGRLLVSLEGHTDQVWGLAFSPDGRLLASASHDKTVKVWEVDPGAGHEAPQRPLLSLEDHSGKAHSIAFSPDGQLLASAGDRQDSDGGVSSGEIIVREVGTGRRVLTIPGHEGQITSLAFSPDGQRLATSGWDRTAKIWDLGTGEKPLVLYGHDEVVTGVAFSLDGTRLASASYDRTVRLWDAVVGQEILILRGHDKRVYGVAFSPDGTRLAAAGGDETVKVWDSRPLPSPLP